MEQELLDEKTSFTTIISPDDHELYQHALVLLIKEEQAARTVVKRLMKLGADEEKAKQIVEAAEAEVVAARKKAATKDIIATLANIGYIFWGAIVFGGIQLVKGVVNYSQNN
jgi:hypothetical protein